MIKITLGCSTGLAFAAYVKHTVAIKTLNRIGFNVCDMRVHVLTMILSISKGFLFQRMTEFCSACAGYF